MEKTFLNGVGIPTAPWAPIEDLDGLRVAVERIGLPAVLKTTRQIGRASCRERVCLAV